MSRAFLVNQGLFQISWPACVVGAAYGVVWAGLLVVITMACWQLRASNRHRLDVRMVGLCLGAGLILDTLWVQLGLLAFATPWPWPGLAPMWIMLLWLALGLVINHSMRVFKGRLILAGLFGAIGSPLSYYAASRIGAVEWVAPAWQVVMAVGLSWAILLPLLFWMARDSRSDKLHVELEPARRSI